MYIYIYIYISKHIYVGLVVIFLASTPSGMRSCSQHFPYCHCPNPQHHTSSAKSACEIRHYRRRLRGYCRHLHISLRHAKICYVQAKI